jgi:hypothetical protein
VDEESETVGLLDKNRVGDGAVEADEIEAVAFCLLDIFR